MNKKALFFFAALVAGGSALWAAQPQAVLQSLKGKVEIKLPGASAWSPATEGQTLSPAAVLSTGFDSSVVVVIDKTTIQVKPLTRMTIDKLVAEGSTVKTTTFLRVGNISASVKSAEGVKQDFKVQSPFSTASVRGTEFDYDGLTLKVKEGLVAFILGRLQREAEGPPSESDYVGAPNVPADPEKSVPVAAGQDAKIVVTFSGEPPKSQSSTDQDSLKKDSGLPVGPPGGPTGPAAPTKGSITLTITLPPVQLAK